MPTPDDLRFKELALSNRYLTEAQIEACWTTLRAYEEAQNPKPFSSICLDKGYLTLKQVSALFQVMHPEQQNQHLIRNYTILSTLGQGGLGTVYKARQEGIGRIVALKIMLSHLATNEEYVKRFMREARISAELNHENIVQGIDFGESEGLYYFAMEYVEGQSLKSIIEEKGKFEEKEAAQIILKMAHALKHAEAHDLVHRDIKPENILLTKKGVPKLCDLGLAKTISTDMTITATGVIMGTPFYISPEQAMGLRDIDIRSDIYSLGITFYQLVTGEVPYQGETLISIVSQHLNGITPSAQSKNPKLSDEVCKIIGIMMQKNREDRYQSAQELVVDLTRFLQGEKTLTSAPWETAQTVAFSAPEPQKTAIPWDQEHSKTPVRMKNPEPERHTPLTVLPPASQPKNGVEKEKIENLVFDDSKTKIDPVVDELEKGIAKKQKRSQMKKVALWLLALAAFALALWGYKGQDLFSRHQAETKIEKEKPILGPEYIAGEYAKKIELAFEEAAKKLKPLPTVQKKNMVLVAGGTWKVGNTAQTIAPFWLDIYEVSKAQYAQFCQETGHPYPVDWVEKGWDKQLPKQEQDYPVTNVSFYDASLYAQWSGKRLPTQAEWEYAACTAKDYYDYPWGNFYEEGYANVGTGKIQDIHFCEKGKNKYGIFQMSGNVWEWTSTLQGLDGENRIIKGGSFDYPPDFARISYEDAFFPHAQRKDLGFRCALDEVKK